MNTLSHSRSDDLSNRQKENTSTVLPEMSCRCKQIKLHELEETSLEQMVHHLLSAWKLHAGALESHRHAKTDRQA